jgi:hypothetical protein
LSDRPHVELPDQIDFEAIAATGSPGSTVVVGVRINSLLDGRPPNRDREEA